MSVTDALFGDLPADVRARYGLTAPEDAQGPQPAKAARADGTAPAAGASSSPATAETARNAAIKAEKSAAKPGRVPGAPSSPWQLSRASWIETMKRVWAEIGNDRVTSVSGGVTFFALLALFPALTALVSIYGLFADRSTIIATLDSLNQFLPASAVDLIRTQIVSIVSAPSKALGIATIIGLLTALYSANGGVKALIDALNVAWFEKESRGFVKLNLVSLAFTLCGIVLVCVMIGAIAVLPAVLDAMNMGSFGKTLASIMRWPLMVGILTAALAALYRWGPDKSDARWQWISPGAIFATLALIIASALFSYYVSHFADYNKTYGSLGATIGLMMWLWIAAIVVMIGAEINSEAERQVQKENGIPLETGPAERQ